MIHSSKPPLSFELGGNHLHAVLRVDDIQRDTLVQLVAKWAEPDARDEVIAALDELADVVHSPRREGELDAAVQEIEDVACMDTAQIEVDMWEARRLLGELTAVVRRLSRFNPKRLLPGQRQIGGAA